MLSQPDSPPIPINTRGYIFLFAHDQLFIADIMDNIQIRNANEPEIVQDLLQGDAVGLSTIALAPNTWLEAVLRAIWRCGISLKLMQSLEDIDPALASNAVGWQSLCAIAIESGYATEALELCDRAIAQQQRPIHYETRAWARAMQEDYQGAIADLKKAQTLVQEPSRVEKLDQWIIQLEQGENPFGERSIIPLQQRERRNQ